MNANESVVALLKALEKLEIDYVVTGSFASNVYGIPRSTKDADFIVETSSERMDLLFDELKPPLRPDPQMLFESITSTRRWLIHLERSRFTLELFILNDHPFDRSRFDRRVRSPLIPGVVAWIPTPEDVVVQKLRWSSLGKRTKDFQDACEVIEAQAETLDWAYVEKWCVELGVTATLAEAREATRP
ncbi:MAG: hypothetical protein JWO82_3890 [Akkermansiaceae bacterium]|nr:hypothetical protein [Akkermansiaceae bacterium]